MNGLKHDTSTAATNPNNRLDIWQFSADVSDRLMLWNAVNIAVGLFLSGRRSPFVRGVASQSIGWGIINILIGLLGKRANANRHARLANPYAPDVQARDTRNLRLLLGGNGLLDVLYIIGGWRLLRRSQQASWRGAGLGIMVQGALLFVFDWRMFRRSFFVRPRDMHALTTRTTQLEQA